MCIVTATTAVASSPINIAAAYVEWTGSAVGQQIDEHIITVE